MIGSRFEQFHSNPSPRRPAPKFSLHINPRVRRPRAGGGREGGEGGRAARPADNRKLGARAPLPPTKNSDGERGVAHRAQRRRELLCLFEGAAWMRNRWDAGGFLRAEGGGRYFSWRAGEVSWCPEDDERGWCKIWGNCGGVVGICNRLWVG